ncbi:MAG: exo-alpha-sialidase [Cyclobacteriaceae bacterium]
MNRIIILAAYSLILFSCSNEKAESTLAISLQESPAGMQSAEPFLFTDKNGTTYLSWVEKKDSVHQFKYATMKDDTWSQPSLIAESNNWFVNWADYPMIASDGEQNIISHVLSKSGPGTFSYDVKMFASNDGGKDWSNSFVIHDDGKQAEHGFVNMVPYKENLFVSWLDGRNTVMEGMENIESDAHGGHHGSMSLRGAIIDYEGNKIDEWELDNKTCDCCQTGATITNNGPIVIYRDRSDEEIRDISIVRLVNGEWTAPKTIFPDNWKIAGCPVNGPRVEAIGNTLAIAWFTVSNEIAQVNAIFSTDGGANFEKPIRIDEGKAIGRVDLVMVDKDNAMVSWMEGTDIKAVKVNRDGSKGTPVVIASTSDSRSSGFPQMTKSGNELVFAWTDDAEKKVKVASIKL